MKILFNTCILLLGLFSLHAENGHSLWFRGKNAGSVTVICPGKSATLQIAMQELQQGWQAKPGAVVLSLKRDKADWIPPYYRQADTSGVGFNRIRSGSDAVSQYHEPLGSQFNDLKTCPEKYLLWFHHLPWDYTMKNGRTLWDEICIHYDAGLKQVCEFQKIRDGAEPFVDAAQFALVHGKLQEHSKNAQICEDACLLCFRQFSRLPFPGEIEKPVNNLEEFIINDMRRF
jgi:alpha-glucuronidase